MPESEQGEREEIGGGTWIGTIVVALAFAVCLFFLLPAGLTNLFKDSIPNGVAFVVIEKLVRIAVFLAYNANSGLPFGPAIKTMIEVMGEDRVMYAMDYPYQYVPDEVRWMDDLDISDAQKKKFFQTNAERWFKL